MFQLYFHVFHEIMVTSVFKQKGSFTNIIFGKHSPSWKRKINTTTCHFLKYRYFFAIQHNLIPCKITWCMGIFFWIRLYHLFKHYFCKQNILIIPNYSCSDIVPNKLFHLKLAIWNFFLFLRFLIFFHAVRCCGKMIRIILDDEAGEFSIEFEIELSNYTSM